MQQLSAGTSNRFIRMGATSMSSDDHVSSTINARTSARKQSRNHRDEQAILRQLKKTQSMLSNQDVDRDAQNAAVVRLVELCGSENHAAIRLGRKRHIVQVRCFEASVDCAEMRRSWPDTESSLLMAIRAKAKSDSDRFERYVQPFLTERLGKRILRSAFMEVWERAKHDGLLPQEKMVLEAEDMADLALTEASSMEKELQSLRAERAALEAKVSVLENALERSDVSGGCTNGTNVLEEFAQDMESLLRGKYVASLEGLLRYADRMLSDRVMILPSAWKSARESDHAGFSPVEPVADLLFKLARECVDQYRQGGHFLPTTILGVAYADSEGSGPISKPGIKRRTFSYHGKTVPMMTHLKYGIGWNKGTTFRAHFCYDADMEKVVIGHFGKHLDR